MLRRLRDFPGQLGVVVSAGLLVRVTAVLTWTRAATPEGDEAFYWRQAQYLSGTYGFVFRNNFGERVTTAVHPPLYSAWLGITGLGPWSNGGHLAFRLATALVGAGAVLAVGLAGRRVGGQVDGDRVGLVAAGLVAVYPNLWMNDAKLTAESVYTLLIAIVFLVSYRYWDQPDRRNAVLLGASLGLAVLARAEAIALFMLLVPPLVWRASTRSGAVPARRARASREVVARIAIVGGVGLIVIGPWVIRNNLAFDEPATVSTGSGFVIEISNCDQTFGLAPSYDPATGAPRPGTDADSFLGYWSPDCDRSDRSAHGSDALPWPEGDETVVEAWKRQIGVDYMRSHKRQLPAVIAARIGRIWDVWRPQQNYDFNVFFERRDAHVTLGDTTIWFQAVATLIYFALMPLALAGATVLWRRRETIIPFVSVAISATLTAAVSFGITRYRVAADVGICILAAVAIDAAVRWAQARRLAGAADADQVGPDGVGS